MSSCTSSSRPLPQKPLDLDLTIVSAKHLKNVNWKNGDLKPYAVFWVDPDRRLSTKSDDSGSTRPVWNERFTLPIFSLPLHDAVLTLEIFHSKPSETPKPLVATLCVPLIDLLDDPPDPTRIRTYTLSRPSGRPQGKIRVKIGIRERPLPDYQFAPPPSYYYTSAPPPPASRDYRGGGGYTAPPLPPPPPQYSTYPEAYPGYYSGYYSSAPPPPLPPRPLFDRTGGYSGPSAPVDYSSSPYDQKPKSGGGGGGGKMMGLGTGLAVGAAAGVLGGLALEEGLKYEEEKIADRVESDLAARDDYSDYRPDY